MKIGFYYILYNKMTDDEIIVTDSEIENTHIPKKSIDELYKNHMKNTNDELKSLNRYLTTYEKSLQNARNKNLHSEIEVIRKTISKYEDKISEKKLYLDKLTNKELDKEMSRYIIVSQKRSEISNAVQISKFKCKEKIKQDEKQVLNNFYSKERSTNRLNNSNKWNMIKAYNYFEKTSNRLPEYMQRNLSEMPNNKGYIWRDIRFYGELPALYGKPDILFEKKKEYMLIHEISNTEHKIFEKRGKDRKKFISSTPLRRM